MDATHGPHSTWTHARCVLVIPSGTHTLSHTFAHTQSDLSLTAISDTKRRTHTHIHSHTLTHTTTVGDTKRHTHSLTHTHTHTIGDTKGLGGLEMVVHEDDARLDCST